MWGFPGDPVVKTLSFQLQQSQCWRAGVGLIPNRGMKIPQCTQHGQLNKHINLNNKSNPIHNIRICLLVLKKSPAFVSVCPAGLCKEDRIMVFAAPVPGA